MSFTPHWTSIASSQYAEIKRAAESALTTRKKDNKSKSSKQEGLFKQVHKSLQYLLNDPKHPSLNTHQYDSLPHPYRKGENVFEAYAQNNTPGAYRIFWCYGPAKGDITIIAIVSHP